MVWSKWKAERLVAWCESGPIRWDRRAWSVWGDAKLRAAKGSRRALAWVLAWLHAHPTASVALAVFGVIAVLLGPVLWVVGGWALIQETTARALTAFRGISEPEKTVEAYGKLIGGVGLLVAAPVGLLGVGLAFWRTWNQHRDGVLAARKLEAESYAKAAEAFAKAVDHLGSDKSSVRMGAVLALEALGKSTPRLLSQAIEILCAFVRENRSVSIPLPTSDEAGAAVSGVMRLPTDIQLIIKIVNRLKRQEGGRRIHIDLSNADLNCAEMNRAELYGANLRGAKLCDANLLRANLNGADLREADLRGVLLRGADLAMADLDAADLRGANLRGTELSRANLERANLSEVDLSRADLSSASLSDANLSRAHLRAANLREANLSEVSLIGANLKDADLSEARLRSANLSEANLSGAKLSGANLWDANLSGANLRDADLSEAKLRETDLSGADLSGADLRGIDLSGAKLCRTVLPDGQVSDRDCSKSIDELRSERTSAGPAP